MSVGIGLIAGFILLFVLCVFAGAYWVRPALLKISTNILRLFTLSVEMRFDDERRSKHGRK